MHDDERKKRYRRIQYIMHDESVALYGRGILVDLRPGQYLIRVEATAAKRPGNWFHGPFQKLAEAERYAKYLADLGQNGIRQENALPRVWPGGAAGNPIEVIRIYRVDHQSPAISSVVAPQWEAGPSFEYAGQGQQLCIPFVEVSKDEGLDLVRRIPGAEIKVTKP